MYDAIGQAFSVGFSDILLAIDILGTDWKAKRYLSVF